MALLVAEALERVRVPYTVGGSLASSFSGEPRASIDVDILVALPLAQVVPLADALGEDFYVNAASLARAVSTASSANIIHLPSGIKVDLFIAGSMLDRLQLQRCRRVQVAANPDRFLEVHAPEDILLQKLHWYRLGGEVSDRQWRDVLSVILVQGDRLDREYLKNTSASLGLSDLLDRAYRHSENGDGSAR